MKKPRENRRNRYDNIWARPEMNVVFRAEIMPGVVREERTFRIEEVLNNGRVTSTISRVSIAREPSNR